MKSAIMMFHLRFPGARSILHRAESHLGPHPPIYARTSIELCLYVPDKGLLHQPGLTTPVKRRGIPHLQVCPACQQGLQTRILSEPACLSSKWYSAHMPISNPAQGRSARFGSTWSGGEVELITLIDSGMEATKLLRRPWRRLALYRMSHEVPNVA